MTSLPLVGVKYVGAVATLTFYSEYDVKQCACVYKNRFIEQTRTWLLKSSCLDILLAM